MAAGLADDLLQHLLLLLQQKGQQLSRRVHPERLQARQHPFDKPQRFEARRHHQPGATVEPQRGGFRAGILRTKQHIVKHSEQIFPCRSMRVVCEPLRISSKKNRPPESGWLTISRRWRD